MWFHTLVHEVAGCCICLCAIASAGTQQRVWRPSGATALHLAPADKLGMSPIPPRGLQGRLRCCAAPKVLPFVVVFRLSAVFHAHPPTALLPLSLRSR